MPGGENLAAERLRMYNKMEEKGKSPGADPTAPVWEGGAPVTLRILVCDDDPVFAARLGGWLRENTARDLHPEVRECTDPTALGDGELSEYDIIFLDIDMGRSNGIDTARRLRRLQARALLIFVTNYVEYSPDGYEVNAFRFLLKSQMEAKLPSYYKDALQLLQRRDAVFTYSLNGETCRVKLRDVLYLESRGRLLCLHTQAPDRGETSFYGKMEEEERRLAESGFVRVHKSYLVNMAHIRRLNYAEVLLDDGTALPVSQRKYPTIRTIYLNWKCEQ